MPDMVDALNLLRRLAVRQVWARRLNWRPARWFFPRYVLLERTRSDLWVLGLPSERPFMHHAVATYPRATVTFLCDAQLITLMAHNVATDASVKFVSYSVTVTAAGMTASRARRLAVVL